MLRLLVLALVLANAGYYAWTHGLLAAYGLAPATQTEPQRLAQQIRPEALKILTPKEASTAQQVSPALGSPASECLQVGVFNDEQSGVLRERLTNVLPLGSWVLEPVQEPARWLVYMGKYNSADSVTKKQLELRGLGVTFEPLSNLALQPGLSLGSFKTRAEADLELARIAKKGVKTAKVVQDGVDLRGQRLTLAVVDNELRSQLDSLKPQLAGKAFKSCS